MRSAELQVVFDKFVEALKKYKGKTVGTAELSALVEEIYGDKLGKNTPAKQLGNLRAFIWSINLQETGWV